MAFEREETKEEKDKRLDRRRELAALNREKLRQKDREYSARNRERINAGKRARYSSDPEKYKNRQKRYRLENQDKVAIRLKSWKSKNATRVADYQRKYTKTDKFKTYLNNRYKNDLNFRIKCCLRARLRAAILNKTKSDRTMALLGCDINHLKKHLEVKFKPGMSWENFGKWHIDHRFPCAKFDLSNPEHQKQCFHWSNLQPLWESENKSKKDKILTHAF